MADMYAIALTVICAMLMWPAKRYFWGSNSQLDRSSKDVTSLERWYYSFRTSHAGHTVSQSLLDKLVVSRLDSGTEAWLAACRNAPRAATAWKHHMATLLRAFGLDRTTRNGLTFRGRMFVFSAEQLLALLPREFVERDGKTLLDIGAGDGGVTAVAADALNVRAATTYVTEASFPMLRRLKWQGYTVVDDLEVVGRQGDAPERFDAVFCLNVVDRVDEPLELLKLLGKLVKPSGFIVLADVFAWSPGVEERGNPNMRAPRHDLPGMEGATSKDNATCEASFTAFMEKSLPLAGFSLIKWTKVPYLCSGDLIHDWYALPDIVMIVKPTEYM